MKTIGRFLALVATTTMLVTPVQADMASDLKDFWENSGGGANVSAPAYYQGQSAGFATLGSVQVRSRSRNSNLVNIQLPSVRAGCGGIDIFGGSFSFISAEELIKMMEAIMQSAAGFAFELALESLSPAVEEHVAKLRDLLQQVNSMNINSCEAGQLLASSLWPKMDGASQHVCSTIGSYQGLFADRIRGKHECGSGGRQNQTLANANAELKDQVPTNINYAWEAIKKNAFLYGDKDLAYFFMTLTGTIITTAPTSDNEGAKHTPIAPAVLDERMVNALVEGGSVEVQKCEDNNRCLKLVSTPIVIPYNKSLMSYTAATIQQLHDAIKSGGNVAMSDEAVALLGMTSVPVLEILVTGMGYQHVFVENEILAMAEIVAVDLAMIYVTKALEEMAKAAGRLQTFGDMVIELKKQISEAQGAFSLRRQLAAERYSQAMRTLERLALAKKELSGFTSSRFAAMME